MLNVLTNIVPRYSTTYVVKNAKNMKNIIAKGLISNASVFWSVDALSDPFAAVAAN